MLQTCMEEMIFLTFCYYFIEQVLAVQLIYGYQGRVNMFRSSNDQQQRDLRKEPTLDRSSKKINFTDKLDSCKHDTK